MTQGFRSCCFCVSLRVGALVIALLGILVNLVGIGVTTYVMDTISPYDFDPYKDWQDKVFRIACIVAIVIGIFGLAVNACLAYGVLADRPVFLLPFMVFHLMGVVLQVCGHVAYSGYLFANGFVIEGVSHLVAGIVSAAIQSYLWLTVYSYYVVLKEADLRGSGVEAPMVVSHDMAVDRREQYSSTKQYMCSS